MSENYIRSNTGTGKTPPPAASALFARRAREMQGDDKLNNVRYRPPQLRTIDSDEISIGPATGTPATTSVDSLPPSNYPPGFRRARAGTLPSNMQLATAQRFGSTVSTPGSQPSNGYNADPYPNSALEPSSYQRQNTPPTALLGSHLPHRPNLKHAQSAAASAMLTTERNSRLRSGSLTANSGGLQNSPFGPSLFASSWLNSNRNSSFPALDELRSATIDSVQDDFDVSTLDYLGLDDGGRPVPTPATLTELRAQAQAAVTGGLTSAPRHRATTVSNPYRLQQAIHNPSATVLGEEGDLSDDEYNEVTIGNLASPRYDDEKELIAQRYRESQLLGANSAGRTRAISMGNIDDHTRGVGLRRGYDESDIYDSDMVMGAGSGYGNQTLPTPILKDGRMRANTAAAPGTVRFPAGEPAGARNVNYGGIPGRISPKQDSPAQVQTPSRSLWIGNLDSSFSSEDLIRVFAPYGAIESLRLLPEKECGFVNFVDQGDAVRAKEDVLNRLGGMIGMANGQAVRVGFGKPDSAPVAPAKGTAVITAQGLATPGGATHLKSPIASNSPGGLDQVQSTPTRALWIGSIPSTTTPAAILSVFSPFGPIESARVLTHKNCGFINFERLDDAVRARKALNGRDVLGSDVGAIRIGFARVPTKNSNGDITTPEEALNPAVQGVGDLSVNASIEVLRNIKGASTINADQQVLSGTVENYRSNLLLSMVTANRPESLKDQLLGNGHTCTEQQMIMKCLSAGSPESDADVQGLSDFRPPTMYYTSIPLVSEHNRNKRWDSQKLRDLRKRLDSGSMSGQDIDELVSDFLDDEIVDLASDWLGNTVVQKLFEKCSREPRLAMLEHLAPHLAMIGIHKNGTWAAQKIIECISTPEEIALVTQHLRPYTPPLLLDQFGNYVVQCCLRFNAPDNEFVFDAMVDRLWEIAQGRFGARSMRACLESNNVTLSQQRRLATAVILNSIPLATNPNGALLLTWLLDTSNFPSRYTLLAPRFTPHLSHLCTHKLASLTVLRLVNQKVEPAASTQVIDGLFTSPSDHVLSDVLSDQVNGVTVVHKILTSPFLTPTQKSHCMEATKRVLVELKVIATPAYRRLIEEVGLPIPNLQGSYGSPIPNQTYPKSRNGAGYGQPDIIPMMSNLHIQPGLGAGLPGFVGAPTTQQFLPTPAYQPNAGYQPVTDRSPRGRPQNSDQFNPFRSPDMSPLAFARHEQLHDNPGNISPPMHPMAFNAQSPSLGQAGNMLGTTQPNFPMQGNVLPPHIYNAYYQMYQQQNPQNVGTFQ